MKKLFAMSLDYSRDVGNSNEFSENRIKRNIYEIVEQNQTKAITIFYTIKTLCDGDKIDWKALLSCMTEI